MAATSVELLSVPKKSLSEQSCRTLNRLTGDPNFVNRDSRGNYRKRRLRKRFFAPEFKVVLRYEAGP